MSFKIYAGPYIKVKIKKVPGFKETRSCSNNECQNKKADLYGNFCCLCASRIETVKKEILVSFNIEKIIATIYPNDEMFIVFELGDFQYIIPNRTEIQGGKYYDHQKIDEIECVPPIGSCEDWAKIKNLLDIERLEYELKIGVIQLYL